MLKKIQKIRMDPEKSINSFKIRNTTATSQTRIFQVIELTVAWLKPHFFQKRYFQNRAKELKKFV